MIKMIIMIPTMIILRGAIFRVMVIMLLIIIPFIVIKMILVLR